MFGDHLSDRTRNLIAFFLLVGLLSGGYAVWAYQNPEVNSQTEATNVQTIETDISTRATVVNSSVLYDEGEVLENSPVYLSDPVPVVNIGVDSKVPVDTQSVRQRIVFVVKGVEDTEDKVFWEEKFVVSQHIEQQTDGTVYSTGTLNVHEVQALVTAATDEIGSAGTVTAELRVTVDYDTGQYEGTQMEVIPVKVIDNAYIVPLSDEGPEMVTTESTPVEREVVDERGYIKYGGVSLVAFVISIGLYLSERGRKELDEWEREMKAYSEWISKGEVTYREDKWEVVELNSIPDMVSIAADTQSRVIFDETKIKFTVISNDVLYVYRPMDEVKSTDSEE